jgi:membrane dipeptidase
MDNNQLPLIFDGHNDVLLKLFNMKDNNSHHKFLDGYDEGHLDLPRMRKGGFGGGFFAIYIPSDLDLASLMAEMSKPQYDIALPEEIPFETALPIAVAKAAILSRIERESGGAVKICTNSAQLRQCFETNTLAIIMHVEGAEAIGEDFSGLEVLYRAGLRSVGPVWSRPTRFGHGVPFRFPASPDTGPGLTDLGKELVKVCNEFKIVVDLAHLNEAGFWDVAKLSDAPLIVTHSNAHALCELTRNLTDRQLAAVRDSGGVVGLNFATSAIRADGQSTSETAIEEMIRHLDYLIEHVGIDGVAMGSDFDGATISDEIVDVSGLPALRKKMRQAGYDEATMKKLCHENWFDVLERTFGS